MLSPDAPVPDAEISAKLGIPAQSIRQNCHGCLQKLRRYPAIATLIHAETKTEEVRHQDRPQRWYDSCHDRRPLHSGRRDPISGNFGCSRRLVSSLQPGAVQVLLGEIRLLGQPFKSRCSRDAAMRLLPVSDGLSTE